MARTRALQQMRAMPQTSLGGTSIWTFIGPQPIENGQPLCGSTTRIPVSGRVTALGFGASTATIYLGAAGGGVWKSVDGGASWSALTDQQVSLAVGALAVIPSANTANDIIYVGTGEGNTSCDSEYGQGILKSVDGGATWSQLGGPIFDRLSFTKLAVVKGATTSSDIIYAATVHGNTNGAAEECFFATSGTSGLYRSSDSGNTWTMLSGSNGLPSGGAPTATKGAASDVVVDPTNANFVYAAIEGDDNGVGGGIFKSSNGGGSWTKLSNGIPDSGNRFAIDIAPNGTTLYAARATTFSSFDRIYKSTDAGASWTSGGAFSSAGCEPEVQPFFDLAIAIDPANLNTIYLGLSGIYKSTDGGIDFSYIGANTHPDYHAIKVNSAGVFAGNDGGITKSTDKGVTWDNSLNNGLGITQFQGIGLAPSGNTLAIGGTQDNGTDLFSGSIQWQHSDDGDGGGFSLIDPQNTQIVFDERASPPLAFRRSANGGTLGSYVDITPSAAAGDPVQFFPPLTEDPHNPDRLLFGTNRVWETLNGTSGSPPNWTPISGDLTGGCTLPSNSGFCDIVGLAVAPTDPKVLYVVTGSDGFTGPLAWVSTNSTASSPSFTNISSGLPNGIPITSVAVSPLNAGTALVTVSGFTGGGEHVFVSTNFGSTWKDISAGLPDIPALTAIFGSFPPSENTIVVGTDIGVFVTQDQGSHWANFNLDPLPIVPVYQLAQNSSIVAAATHGRGVWTFANSVLGSAPTPTSTPSATPTATATATASPTAPVPTPTPGSGAQITVPAQVNVNGSQGQTVAAGTFNLRNTSSNSEIVTSVTIGVSHPSLYSALALNGTVANPAQNQAVTVTSPGSSPVFTFNPPFSVPARGTLNFSLAATISNNAAMLEVPTVAYAAIGVSSGTRSGASPLGVGVLLLAVMTLALPPRTRRRAFAALTLLILLASTQVGCGGDNNASPSSTQAVTAVSASNPGGAGVGVAGLPAALGTVTLQ